MVAAPPLQLQNQKIHDKPQFHNNNKKNLQLRIHRSNYLLFEHINNHDIFFTINFNFDTLLPAVSSSSSTPTDIKLKIPINHDFFLPRLPPSCFVLFRKSQPAASRAKKTILFLRRPLRQTSHQRHLPRKLGSLNMPPKNAPQSPTRKNAPRSKEAITQPATNFFF